MKFLAGHRCQAPGSAFRSASSARRLLVRRCARALGSRLLPGCRKGLKGAFVEEARPDLVKASPGTVRNSVPWRFDCAIGKPSSTMIANRLFTACQTLPRTTRCSAGRFCPQAPLRAQDTAGRRASSRPMRGPCPCAGTGGTVSRAGTAGVADADRAAAGRKAVAKARRAARAAPKRQPSRGARTESAPPPEIPGAAGASAAGQSAPGGPQGPVLLKTPAPVERPSEVGNLVSGKAEEIAL